MGVSKSVENYYFRFMEEIRKTVKNFSELMTDEFSTTGTINRINYITALMSSREENFDYALTLNCGIPSVITAGSIKDWEHLGVR